MPDLERIASAAVDDAVSPFLIALLQRATMPHPISAAAPRSATRAFAAGDSALAKCRSIPDTLIAGSFAFLLADSAPATRPQCTTPVYQKHEILNNPTSANALSSTIGTLALKLSNGAKIYCFEINPVITGSGGVRG